jgi:hypothetical protein
MPYGLSALLLRMKNPRQLVSCRGKRSQKGCWWVEQLPGRHAACPHIHAGIFLLSFAARLHSCAALAVCQSDDPPTRRPNTTTRGQRDHGDILKTRVSQSCFKENRYPGLADNPCIQKRQHWTAPRKGRRPCAVLLRPVAGAP